jgi:hypothetical protein
MRRVHRIVRRAPAYRWECGDCEATETYGEALGRGARKLCERDAREHATEEGHLVMVLRFTVEFDPGLDAEELDPGSPWNAGGQS